ncbi:MAG: S41 family peptidase [Dehalococcoidia bacterium]
MAPVSATVALLLAACHPAAGSTTVVPLTDAPAPVLDVASPVKLAPVDVVRQAYGEISQQLFREVTPRELLAPAWQAIAAEARRQGVLELEVRRHGARGSDDIEAFAREFTAFAKGAGSSLDPARLSQVSVRAMAGAVGDSHTRFLTPEQADLQRRSADGDVTYSGIGVRIDQNGGGLMIAEVYTDSPADKAGLRAGTASCASTERRRPASVPPISPAHVRGPEGTEVRLTIQRDDEDAREVALSRARIPVPVVTSRMLSDDVGYLRIASFPRKSMTVDAARDFDDQLRRLVSQGYRGLVLDLRGTPAVIRLRPWRSPATSSRMGPSSCP